MGLGSFGGSSQMLFGGTGGQDLFQKITWILGIIFMAGSLWLSLMRTHRAARLPYLRVASVPQNLPDTTN